MAKGINKTKSTDVKSTGKKCPIFHKCGGCQFLDIPYEKQLQTKQKRLEKLLGEFERVSPILPMKEPFFYRNKVHSVFARDKKGTIYYGTYQEGTHRVLSTPLCYIEDKKCQEIMETISQLAKSFRWSIYQEDAKRGLLRHVLLRRGFATGQIMVVLVMSSTMVPSKNNFIKALRSKHPEITTIVLNINDKKTSMVLGERQQVWYGKGFIIDELCGYSFRISPKSFYQVNPVQTELLYQKAVEFADLTGKEVVFDAYCGIGTIGMVASEKAKRVIGVELNPDAVKDAKRNAKDNKVENIEFVQGDASDFMVAMANRKETVDVVFMDPPRAGSDQRFIQSVAKLSPKKVVYISCEPTTLARDLKDFAKVGYRVRKIQPVELFPMTEHCEACCLLVKSSVNAD